MITLISPAELDPHHFDVGDEIQLGPEACLFVGVVTVAQPDGDGFIRVHMNGHHARTRSENLLHRDGCQACREYLEAWAAQQDHQWQEERARYTPAALELADTLVRRGLLQISTSGSPCGHTDAYIVAPDAPLPSWLQVVLKGAVFTAPEGPWPNWGRTDYPIDWPTLISAHPDVLMWDRELLECNQGATADSIAEAVTLLRTADPRLRVDVCLWVSTSGRITVEPCAFWTDTHVPDDLAQRVDTILIAGGRDGDALHRGPFKAGRGWVVEC
ncbi:hypothetical protein [Mycolicibacterium mageritense]|uniref:hypothetical protein n=1 Tax=Mycolicibacterium mageritense TaxID=53462 RepID=UPI0011D7E379|nr:hypothetical protein [Mycolicibacterium mageritense]TXI53501.1 MAG: hypothetical protein E6Q55_35035 [Mycolicibacterium mageritense]